MCHGARVVIVILTHVAINYYNCLLTLIFVDRKWWRHLNGNIFRATGPLWRESTGHRWIPSQRPVTWSFDVFFDLCLDRRLSKQSRRCWFETPSRSFWRHRNKMAGYVVTWLASILVASETSVVDLIILPEDLLNILNYFKVADFDWYSDHVYISADLSSGFIRGYFWSARRTTCLVKISRTVSELGYKIQKWICWWNQFSKYQC